MTSFAICAKTIPHLLVFVVVWTSQTIVKWISTDYLVVFWVVPRQLLWRISKCITLRNPSYSWLVHPSKYSRTQISFPRTHFIINDYSYFVIFSSSSSNISNARKSVSSDIQTLRSGLKKEGAAEFFYQRRSVRISDETLFRVFDISSQSIDNSWRNSRHKFTEFSSVWYIFSKRW